VRRLTPKTIESNDTRIFSPHTEPRLRVTIGHQVINGGGVKGLRAQDGHSDYPITLGIDMVGRAAGLDVDLNFLGRTRPRANGKDQALNPARVHGALAPVYRRRRLAAA
jgi:hypothetical protein